MSANVTSIETARAKMVYAALVAAGFRTTDAAGHPTAILTLTMDELERVLELAHGSDEQHALLLKGLGL